MAIIKAVHSNASIAVAVNYVTKNEKSTEKLISGKDCNYYSAIDEMKATKSLWKKSDGRQYDHYVQSFASGEHVTPEAAHEIANRWAEEQFPGHECLVATHIDKNHLHNHIIVNSVNFEDGSKLHRSAKWLEQAKLHSDELCRRYGLSITQKGKTFEGMMLEDMTSFSKDKYQFLLKAETGNTKSYVLETSLAVLDSKQVATSRDDFIVKMAEKGYQTNWQECNKNITFTDIVGNKVRAANIEKTFKIDVAKDSLEKEFKQNREKNMKLDEIRDKRQQGSELPIEPSHAKAQSESQTHEKTAEEIKCNLITHKTVYMDLEKQIQKQNEINAQMQKEYGYLASTSETLREKERTIQNFDTEISKLQEQRQGLGRLQLHEKKRIDEQLDRLSHSRLQAVCTLERSYGIKPEQITQTIDRLADQQQQLKERHQNPTDVTHLRELQKQAEIEYKAEKLVAEYHPACKEINDFLKQSRPQDERMHDRLITVQAESRLNDISRADLDKIREAKPEDNNLKEIIRNKSEQMQQRNDFNRVRERGR